MAIAEEHALGKGTQKVDLSDVKNSDIAKAIDEYIHSERDRKILVLRLIDGLTYEQIAEAVDMSARQVKNIVYKAQDRLFGKIG